jgi:hypothetical protein
MAQHKWHKEIKAWADGAEIEMRETDVKNPEWIPFEGEWYNSIHVEYRIKPQPKEPQYLYVYSNGERERVSLVEAAILAIYENNREYELPYIGKIKLEQDDAST